MRKQIAELEAKAEELRLSTMEGRLQKYPEAAQYELKRAQLETARALAENTRTVQQIGGADDITRAYVMREFLQEQQVAEKLPILIVEEAGQA